MKRSSPRLLVTAATLCATVLLSAQSYPHAFPRDGVTKLVDNARVTIWQVEWKTGGPVPPIHRHLYDLAAVYLRYGPIKVTTPDGKATVQQPFDVPRPYFQKAGVTHREEGVAGPGEPTRLAIMVDLKDPTAGAVPVQAVPGVQPAFPREGAKNVLDNERVRFWDYTWQPNLATAMHVHDRDSIEIFIDGGTIQYTSRDGKVETKTYAWKDARFVPRGTVDTEKATSGSPRAMTIEIK